MLINWFESLSQNRPGNCRRIGQKLSSTFLLARRLCFDLHHKGGKGPDGGGKFTLAWKDPQKRHCGRTPLRQESRGMKVTSV